MLKRNCKKISVVSLKRIEGQVRGLQKMVDTEQDCTSILNQIRAVIGALARVEKNIVETYLELSLEDIRKEKSLAHQRAVLKEMLNVINKTKTVK